MAAGRNLKRFLIISTQQQPWLFQLAGSTVIRNGNRDNCIDLYTGVDTLLEIQMKTYLVKYLVEGIYRTITVLCANILDCKVCIIATLGYQPKVVIIRCETGIQ